MNVVPFVPESVKGVEAEEIPAAGYREVAARVVVDDRRGEGIRTLLHVGMGPRDRVHARDRAADGAGRLLAVAPVDRGCVVAGMNLPLGSVNVATVTLVSDCPSVAVSAVAVTIGAELIAEGNAKLTEVAPLVDAHARLVPVGGRRVIRCADVGRDADDRVVGVHLGVVAVRWHPATRR